MTYPRATVHPDKTKCILCKSAEGQPRIVTTIAAIHEGYHELPETRQWLLMWIMKSLLDDLVAKKPPGIRLRLGAAGLLEIVFRAGRFENRLA